LIFRHQPPFLGDVEDFFMALDRLAVPFSSDEYDFRPGWRAYLMYPFRRWL
jgi:hypothetical protein